MSKRLRDIISELESTDTSLCIVAKRPWQPDSEALLVRLTENYRVPGDTLAQGYECFLEVSVDLGSVLSSGQRMSAILYYAEHDAYPEWLGRLFSSPR